MLKLRHWHRAQGAIKSQFFQYENAGQGAVQCDGIDAVLRGQSARSDLGYVCLHVQMLNLRKTHEPVQVSHRSPQQSNRYLYPTALLSHDFLGDLATHLW